jgi:hypothetical protein
LKVLIYNFGILIKMARIHTNNYFQLEDKGSWSPSVRLCVS